jgi:hypothetical protein
MSDFAELFTLISFGGDQQINCNSKKLAAGSGQVCRWILDNSLSAKLSHACTIVLYAISHTLQLPQSLNGRSPMPLPLLKHFKQLPAEHGFDAFRLTQKPLQALEIVPCYRPLDIAGVTIGLALAVDFLLTNLRNRV